MSENIEMTFNVATPARLSVSNIRGSVEIPPGSEPSKTVSSKERWAVLERVERGEMTVDEALGQLHA